MRPVIVLLVIGVVAGALLALTANSARDGALPSPTAAAPTATPLRTPLLTIVVETPLPPTPNPDGSVPQTPDPGPAGSPPATRTAGEVNCDDPSDAGFCSTTTESIVVSGGKLQQRGSLSHDTNYSQIPTTLVSSRVERPDRADAVEGDEVDTLHITVTVDNRTDRTFVLPRREVLASLTRDGRPVALPESAGEPIELGPGAKLSATFSVPVDADGAWSWRGKTWFHPR